MDLHNLNYLDRVRVLMPKDQERAVLHHRSIPKPSTVCLGFTLVANAARYCDTYVLGSSSYFDVRSSLPRIHMY